MLDILNARNGLEFRIRVPGFPMKSGAMPGLLHSLGLFCGAAGGRWKYTYAARETVDDPSYSALKCP